MEKDGLLVVKLTQDAKYMKIFETAILTGKVVLMEEVPE